jgi:hypothetical protein
MHCLSKEVRTVSVKNCLSVDKELSQFHYHTTYEWRNWHSDSKFRHSNDTRLIIGYLLMRVDQNCYDFEIWAWHISYLFTHLSQSNEGWRQIWSFNNRKGSTNEPLLHSGLSNLLSKMGNKWHFFIFIANVYHVGVHCSLGDDVSSKEVYTIHGLGR